MARIFLGLGSNVGNKKGHVQKAITLLNQKIRKIKIAPLYLSKPVGYAAQNDFLNTAVAGETNLSPKELLLYIQNVEQEVGRVKSFKNGPREIDIDILFYDELIYKVEDLVIPHPGIETRDFVLKPLIDLDSKIVHPQLHQSVKELYNKLKKENRSIISTMIE